MKMRFSHLLLLLTLASAIATGCGKSSNAQAAFWVRGNCDMCKATIEEALNGTAGVASATYDLDAHTLHVDYDSTRIQLGGLHKACAAAGYDTKEALAEVAAYDALPKCCKKPEDQ